jgi:hypothetical protein
MILPILHSLRPRWLMLAFAAAWMGCANPHEPAAADRVHGVILLPQLSSLSIFAPQSARVGIPVNVTVRTFGSSSCDKPAGMDVSHSANEVLFVPWVTNSRQFVACTDDIHSHQHQASVTFTQSGTARLVAFGYKMDEHGGRALGTVSQSIEVTP